MELGTDKPIIEKNYLILMFVAIAIIALYSLKYNLYIAIIAGIGVGYLLFVGAESLYEYQERPLWENAASSGSGVNRLPNWNSVKATMQSELYGDIRMYVYIDPETQRRCEALIWCKLDRMGKAIIDSVFNPDTNPGMGVSEVRDLAIKKGYKREEAQTLEEARKVCERAGYEVVRKSEKDKKESE